MLSWRRCRRPTYCCNVLSTKIGMKEKAIKPWTSHPHRGLKSSRQDHARLYARTLLKIQQLLPLLRANSTFQKKMCGQTPPIASQIIEMYADNIKRRPFGVGVGLGSPPTEEALKDSKKYIVWMWQKESISMR